MYGGIRTLQKINNITMSLAVQVDYNKVIVLQITETVFMSPPPMGSGGIMFLGCLSVCASVGACVGLSVHCSVPQSLVL